VNDRITLSGTWVYGTGQALTLPQGQYWVQGSNGLKKLGDAKPYYTQRVYSEYGERNNFRQAPYHRLDIGIQFHKKMGRRERTWEISFYNAYNRQNPFFYYLDAVNVSTEPQVKKIENRLKQITLFPVLPSVSYGYKF
ncbi:MAG: TonB-dependent receptor, partial [Siphonobacter aquaeclarae]|nr:TonB-dependent receptor [Siphonobacter aquaeclarae]